MYRKIPVWLDTTHSGQHSADNRKLNDVMPTTPEKASSLIKTLSENQHQSFDLNDILTANYNNNQWQK